MNRALRATTIGVLLLSPIALSACSAGQVTQMARDNALAAGAIAGVLLGTSGGRQVAGTALKLGGLAAIAGLGYQAYKNYKAGQAPAPATPDAPKEPELLPPPSDSGFATQTVSDDFALGPGGRKWLDDDEYLVRRRIHADMKRERERSGI